jgi:hypothetical protein
VEEDRHVVLASQLHNPSTVQANIDAVADHHAEGPAAR